MEDSKKNIKGGRKKRKRECSPEPVATSGSTQPRKSAKSAKTGGGRATKNSRKRPKGLHKKGNSSLKSIQTSAAANDNVPEQNLAISQQSESPLSSPGQGRTSTNYILVSSRASPLPSSSDTASKPPKVISADLDGPREKPTAKISPRIYAQRIIVLHDFSPRPFNDRFCTSCGVEGSLAEDCVHRLIPMEESGFSSKDLLAVRT